MTLLPTVGQECLSFLVDQVKQMGGSQLGVCSFLPKGIAERVNVTHWWVARSSGVKGGIMVAAGVQPYPHQGSHSQRSSVGTPPKHPSRERASNCAPATSEEVISLQAAQATKGLFH